jgi:hypothetical protein
MNQQKQQKSSESFAFKEGYYAFSRGWLSCKYNSDSTKGKEWQRGFDRAYFDNLAALKRQ